MQLSFYNPTSGVSLGLSSLETNFTIAFVTSLPYTSLCDTCAHSILVLRPYSKVCADRMLLLCRHCLHSVARQLPQTQIPNEVAHTGTPACSFSSACLNKNLLLRNSLAGKSTAPVHYNCIKQSAHSMLLLNISTSWKHGLCCAHFN